MQRRPCCDSARRSSARVREVAARTERERDLALALIGQVDHDLHRETRIERGADAVRQPRSPERGWASVRAVTADELEPVAADGALLFAALEERDPAGEFGRVCVAREQRAGLDVDLGDDVRGHRRALRAEHELEVHRDRELARAAGSILELQLEQLRGYVHRDERRQLRCDAAFDGLEHGIAEAVARRVRLATRRRQRCGRPHRAIVFVANVNRFAARVGDEIVVPWRESIGVCILTPRVRTTALADDGSEIAIREHVAPRRRCSRALVSDDHVLPAIMRESTVAVPRDEI